MARRCSHCGNNGHNSRTCREKAVKLFGVTLTDGCIRMSMCMENLANCSSATQNSSSPITDNNSESIPAAADGYLSEETTQETNRGRERKKGIPWTMEEHRMFLEGLKKLGKGDWRGISKGFVNTRTPTQVASHAQKYFMRQCNSKKPKRRSSLFDITSDTDASEFLGEEASAINNEGSETMTRLSLSRNQYASSDLTSPVIIPLSFSLWPPFASEACSKPPISSSVVKPVAILPTGPIKIDICKENAELKLSISPPPIESSSLSLKLSDYHSRNSAFHENASFSKNADLSTSGNAIKVL